MTLCDKEEFFMAILKLKPYCRETIWGGTRLRDEYHIPFEGKNLAEAWVLSCHPAGASIIENGPHAGQTLTQYLAEQGKAALGSFGMIFEDFPILIKFIDAADALSIQVHPSNYYAMEHEHQYGKTEMWYIMDAEPGAFIYYGFKDTISKEELSRRIRENTLQEVLNAVPVEKGDCFFIPSGTLHAIGKGILIAEVQQNSDVTYRVYDYARRDVQGNLRELHVQKASEVTKCAPPREDYNFGGHLARCEYFTVDRLTGNYKGQCDDESFVSLLVLDGKGSLSCGEESASLQKGESYFLPANSGAYTITGTCEILKTTVGTI